MLLEESILLSIKALSDRKIKSVESINNPDTSQQLPRIELHTTWGRARLDHDIDKLFSTDGCVASLRAGDVTGVRLMLERTS